MPNNEFKDINVLIDRVTLLSYKINEEYILNREKKNVVQSISQRTRFNILQEIAAFEIDFNYIDQSTNEQFLSITVLSQFKLPGLLAIQQLDDKGKLLDKANVPRPLLVTCFSISVTQTRTLLTQLIATSKLSRKVPFSIIDPALVANKMYPPEAGDLYELDVTKIDKGKEVI